MRASLLQSVCPTSETALSKTTFISDRLRWHWLCTRCRQGTEKPDIAGLQFSNVCNLRRVCQDCQLRDEVKRAAMMIMVFLNRRIK
jgi:hypothetical protein